MFQMGWNGHEEGGKPPQSGDECPDCGGTFVQWDEADPGKDDENMPSKKRLPPYRRRQLQNSLWLISMRLKKVTDALKGTPDGETPTHWDDRAEHHITNARMFLDNAESLLLGVDESEGA